MKKKFLSLMMAAAVVATTSVSAFAAENDVTMPNTANVITQDNEDGTAQVKINGNIQDVNGNDAPDTFKVTVPTAANFTVNQNGVLVGPELVVKNQGKQSVEVYAQNFSAGKGNIKVIPEDTIDKDTKSDSPKLNRTSISLKLRGDSEKIAYLEANEGKSGVHGQPDLKDKTTKGILLTTLSAGTEEHPTSKSINLEGSAGSQTIQKAVSDSFTLTLKIKKVTKGNQVPGVSQGPGSDSAPGDSQVGDVDGGR